VGIGAASAYHKEISDARELADVEDFDFYGFFLQR
jgi:hypothetical protein